MQTRNILAAFAVLLVPSLTHAEDPIAAQPITLATTAGNEQSDFFLTRDKHAANYVVFSSNLKTVVTRGVQLDERAMFVQRIYSLNTNETDFAVDKFNPLKKLTTFKVAAGTTFGMFLTNPNSENEQTVPGFPQEFFHVPGKGLYVSTGGGAPALVKVDTLASPVTGAALQNPGFTANDHDVTEQFRIVLGAKDPHKGYEPFVSSGPVLTTKLLADLEPGAAGSNPQQFTTFNNIVYFLAQNDENGTSVFRVTQDQFGKQAKFGAATVFTGLQNPDNLVGCGEGLFFTQSNGSGSDTSLYVSTDGSGLVQVPGGGIDPEQLTPNLQVNQDGFGYSSVDDNGLRRFTQYTGITQESFFTDATATVTDPTNITNTVNYFIYGGTYLGQTYVFQDFTGGGGPEFIHDSDGNYLSNLGEICYVHNPEEPDSGTLYFIADVTINGVLNPGVLWTLDPDDETDIATPVKSKFNKNVVGAHNLRMVSGDNFFRLYFCAPVNSQQNADFIPAGSNITDFGTKPWVTTE